MGERKEYSNLKDFLRAPNYIKYKKNPIGDVKLNVYGVTGFDENLAKSLINLPKINNFGRLMGATHNLVNFFHVNAEDRLKNINLIFYPGETQDSVRLHLELQRNKYWINQICNLEHNYFRLLLNIWQPIRKSNLLERVNGGYGYGWKKSKHSLESTLTFRKWGHFRPEYRVQMGRLVVNERLLEYFNSQRFRLIWDLYPRSQLFPDHYYIFQDNYIYIQGERKSRRNRVDIGDISPTLASSVIYPDTLEGIRVGYLFNRFKQGDTLLRGKGSLGFGRNRVDVPFLKGKMKLGVAKQWENLGFHGCIYMGYVRGLGGGNLRANDLFYIRGMRGLPSVGQREYKHLVPGQQHVGDIIGSQYIGEFRSELYLLSVPPFRYTRDSPFKLLPFVYFDGGVISESRGGFWPLASRVAGGFGLALLNDIVNIRLYYNLGVSKRSSDLQSEYGIQFGF